MPRVVTMPVAPWSLPLVVGDVVTLDWNNHVYSSKMNGDNLEAKNFGIVVSKPEHPIAGGPSHVQVSTAGSPLPMAEEAPEVEEEEVYLTYEELNYITEAMISILECSQDPATGKYDLPQAEIDLILDVIAKLSP